MNKISKNLGKSQRISNISANFSQNVKESWKNHQNFHQIFKKITENRKISPKISKKVHKIPKNLQHISKSFTKCQRISKNLGKIPKNVQNSLKCHNISKNVSESDGNGKQMLTNQVVNSTLTRNRLNSQQFSTLAGQRETQIDRNQERKERRGPSPEKNSFEGPFRMRSTRRWNGRSTGGVAYRSATRARPVGRLISAIGSRLSRLSQM